ncbi:MAG: hypothetical protein HW387_2 [Parachlamydiales bacterium]|nr:hypothetical protein [Parachlamydiales bacterium]
MSIPSATDDFVTPPHTPRAPEPKQTPKEIRVMNDTLSAPRTYDPSSLSPGSVGKIERGMNALKDLDTPERIRHSANAVNSIAFSMFGNDPTSPPAHRILTHLNPEGVVKQTLQELNKNLTLDLWKTLPAYKILPSCVIDIDHLTGSSRKGGMHVLFGTAPQLKSSVRHPVTGVTCGTWDEVQKDGTTAEKFSSCFPFQTEQEIIDYALSATPIAKYEGKKLIHKKGIHSIAYLRKETVFRPIKELYRSLFPLFYYGVFCPSAPQDYLISPDIAPLQGTDIRNAARKIVASCRFVLPSDSQVLFVTLNSLIIDIAPHFQERTGVARGIVMEFPDACFEELYFPDQKRPELMHPVQSCIANWRAPR